METKLNLIRLDVSTGIVELDVTKSDQGLEERLEGNLYKVKKNRMTDKKLRALCAEILGEKLPKNADPYIAYGIIDALKRDDYVDEPYTKKAIKAVVDQYLDALEFDNAVIGKEIEEEPTAIVYERIYRSKFRIRGRDLEKVVMPYMRDVRNRDVYSYRINCIDVRDPIEKAVDFIEGMKRSIRRKRNSEYWENAEMIYEDGELKFRNGESEEEQETEPEAEKKEQANGKKQDEGKIQEGNKQGVSEPEQTAPSQEAVVEGDSKKQEESSAKPAKPKSKHDEYVEKKRQEDAERKVEKPSTKKQKEAKKEQIRKAVEEIDFDINL